MLVLGDLRIPLGLVSAFSYTLKARLIESASGKISACGSEAPECSVRIVVTPALCALFGVDYSDTVQMLMGLDISRKSAPSVLRIGDFVPCRNVMFSPTSINYSADSEFEQFEFDLVLSPVKNALQSTSNRASSSTGGGLPDVVLHCGGQSLAMSNEISFSELIETPDGCSFAAYIGDDSRLSTFEAWAQRLTQGGQVSISTSEIRKYYVTTAEILNGELSITGSIYPPEAFLPVTKTYTDTDISDILRDICGLFGFSCNANVHGAVQYYLLQNSPIKAIDALQNSAGFLTSATAGSISFVDVPEKIETQMLLHAIPMDDAIAERTTRCVWLDGEHEFVEGDASGNSILIHSAFNSASSSFAKRRIALENYRNRSFSVELPLDLRVILHSPVAIQTRSEVRRGLVEYYMKDYITNTMELHINTLEGL